MMQSSPHYFLYARADASGESGRWQFSLRSTDGSKRLEAADVEPGVQGERLDLLAVVRALESLDEPARVTMVGCSRYVRHGMQYGLLEWRNNGWRWEAFGQLVPVKNVDLWQRVDRALRFHRVECNRRRIDPAHQRPSASRRDQDDAADGATEANVGITIAGQDTLRYRASHRSPHRRRVSVWLRHWRRRRARSRKAAKPEIQRG